MARKLYATSIALPAPMMAGSCDPIDPRIVVEYKSDLTTNAADTFGTVGDYCKVYEGIIVYVSSENASYMYIGPAVEGSGILLSEVQKEGNWIKVADKDFNLNTIQGGITDSNAAILAETNRATAAELKLTNDLASEIDRATKAEQDLLSGLQGEIDRATEAESKKADIVELSNVLGEEVVGDDVLESIETVTVDELKKELFIDMWNTACRSFGRYNRETKYFELNELTDLTYAEALKIYQLYSHVNYLVSHHSFQLVYGVRTLIPNDNILMNAGSGIASNYFDSSLFVTIRLSKNPITIFSPNITNFFGRNGVIRKWLDVITWFGNTVTNNNKITFSFNTFDWYENHPFEYFRFKNVNFNVNCRYYPNIGIDSFQYLVNNRFSLTLQGANPFTITVHPNVYAKLTGDTTNAAAAALTEEELAQWQQLLADATEKQITFAIP